MLQPATAAMKPAIIPVARASPSAIAMVEPPPTFEPQAFEAQGDPLQALILIGAILVPFGYWWLITVPEARIGLAKDKRLDTDLNEYLVELKEADDRPVHFQEIFATLYHNMGIDINKVSLPDLSGRPQFLVDTEHQPLPEVV